MATVPGGSVEWHGNEYFMLATKETITAMKKASIHTQGVAKKMIGKGGGKPHRPSAPGRPPHRDTGILASSVSYEVKVKGRMVNGYIGPDVTRIKKRLEGKKSRKSTDPEYGLYLEKGTKHMAARPWLKPSVIKATPMIISIFRKALGVFKL